ncbi:MAG: L-threonylcarbamoyladenylate synthase, partial [Acidimicrobiales bacterium]
PAAMGSEEWSAQVDEIVEVLEGGGVVVLPTDTVYGLAALPSAAAAVDRVFALKGRRADVPIAVLCASAAQALALAEPVPGVDQVAARFWPGPLTLVLPRRAGVHLHLGEPTHTIGLRVPRHELIRAVAERVGPVATTSANQHGSPTPPTAREAGASLVGDPDLVVDGGRLEASASTVVAATGMPWTVLRAGPIDPDEVIAVGIG